MERNNPWVDYDWADDFIARDKKRVETTEESPEYDEAHDKLYEEYDKMNHETQMYISNVLENTGKNCTCTTDMKGSHRHVPSCPEYHWAQDHIVRGVSPSNVSYTAYDEIGEVLSYHDSYESAKNAIVAYEKTLL